MTGPRGVWTAISSPAMDLSSARPTGEATDNRPDDGSASAVPTSVYVSVVPSI